MPNVRLQRELPIPPGSAYEMLAEILRAIAAQEGPWRGFALHVSLGELHLPDVGYIAVPVHLVVESHADPSTLNVTFAAARSSASFPTFKGTMGVEPGGTSDSVLWLSGAYDVPLSLFGRFFDATMAGGVAERSLVSFLEDIAKACTARVDEREAESMRYRLFEH